MRIGRSKKALASDSMRVQVLDLFLWAHVGGKTFVPTFEDLCAMCEGDGARVLLLDAIIGLLDDGFLIERPDRTLVLVRPNDAMVEAGFYPEDCLDLVPEGEDVFFLSEEVEQMVAEIGVEEAAAKIASGLEPELAKLAPN